MSNVIVFADGGSRGNPGPAACGYVIYETKQNFADHESALKWALNSEPTHSNGDYLGAATNNVAEWQGVLKGLEYVQAQAIQIDSLFVFLDSQLVVRQISGQYKVKQPHLKPLHTSVMQILKTIREYQVHHVYRHDNSLADEQVNIVLDEQN
jgi:ribonuclease HI